MQGILLGFASPGVCNQESTVIGKELVLDLLLGLLIHVCTMSTSFSSCVRLVMLQGYLRKHGHLAAISYTSYLMQLEIES